jgi:LCP family protein required for cell wall assembly
VSDLAEVKRRPFRVALVALVAAIVLGTGIYFQFFREGEPDQQVMSPQLRLTGPDDAALGLTPTAETGSDDGMVGTDKPSEPLGASGSAPLVVVFGIERFGETSRPDAVAVIGVDEQTGCPIVVALRPDQELGDDRTIASAYERLGPLPVTKSIGSLLSLPLAHYITLDYQVFESMIDKLGGVQVAVDEAFAATSADGSRVTLKPGNQNLNGKQALAYIRYKWAGDETARMQRHAAFLQALRSRLSQRNIVVMLPSLIRDVFALVETNVTLTAALSIAEQMRWSEMSNYRLIVVADGVSGSDDFVVFGNPAEFVASGIRFAGVDQAL